MEVSSYVALFLVFMSGIGYSAQSLIIKLLSEHGFHGSFQLIFMRGSVQMLITAVLILTSSSPPSLFGSSSKTTVLLWARGLFGFAAIALAFLSLEYIPIADSITLFMMSPFYAAILSFFFLGEPWLCAEYIGALISLIGVVLVTRPPVILSLLSLHQDPERAALSSDERDQVHFGMICATVSGMFSGTVYTIIRVLGTTSKMPWTHVAFVQGLVQILLAPPSMYMTGQHLSLDLSMITWGSLLLAAVVGSCSQFSMTVGMQHEKSARASMMRMSDVLGGFLWQYLFTKDPVNMYTMAGAALISLGVVVVVLWKSQNIIQEESEQEESGSIVQLMKRVELQVAGTQQQQRYSQLQREEEEEDHDVEVGEEDIDSDMYLGEDGCSDDDDLAGLCMTDKEMSFLDKLEESALV